MLGVWSSAKLVGPEFIRRRIAVCWKLVSTRTWCWVFLDCLVIHCYIFAAAVRSAWPQLVVNVYFRTAHLCRWSYQIACDLRQSGTTHRSCLEVGYALHCYGPAARLRTSPSLPPFFAVPRLLYCTANPYIALLTRPLCPKPTV